MPAALRRLADERRGHAGSSIAERLALQAGPVSLTTSKLYARAVLPPAILACSSSGTPARISERILRDRGRQLAVPIIRAPNHVVGADDVAQANADGVLLEAQDDVAAEEVARERSVERMSASSSAMSRADARFGGLHFANPPYARFGELGDPAAPDPAQCHYVGSCYASRRRRPHCGVQPLR